MERESIRQLFHCPGQTAPLFIALHPRPKWSVHCNPSSVAGVYTSRAVYNLCSVVAVYTAQSMQPMCSVDCLYTAATLHVHSTSVWVIEMKPWKIKAMKDCSGLAVCIPSRIRNRTVKGWVTVLGVICPQERLFFLWSNRLCPISIVKRLGICN